MMRKLVPEWLNPPLDRAYRKPKNWADYLKPKPSAAAANTHPPEALQNAVLKAQNALLKQQNAEGYWCGPLRADTTLESDTIMLLHFLGRGDSAKVRRLADRILQEQLPDGGWPIYKNGPADISATVKAYWALKFAGHAPSERVLIRARAQIKELGGIHKVNTYTKLYLAIFGQYDWRGVPSIPPEIMLFPNWFYFNIYEMSAWTRSIVVPLSLVWAFKPSVPCPARAEITELFGDDRRHIPLKDAVAAHSRFSWTRFFLFCDDALKWRETHGGLWLRAWSLRSAEEWILKRLQFSDGLGAIYPGIVNTIMAMKCLGYSDTDPRLTEQIRTLDRLEHTEEGSQALELQPCHLPVWDTAISMIALAESGLERNHPAMKKAAQWLISKEIKIEGDWKVTNPKGPIGGWPFQFNNSFYADVDDTAMVMLALRHSQLEEPSASAREKACLRGLHWVLSMQSSSGGWAAFDKENTKTVLTKIPFADHNAMIDPPYADITARVLELLGRTGYDASYPVAQKALSFLKAEQEPDGSWYGRWCVNYIYGTWQALRGLAAMEEPADSAVVRRAVAWLKSVQHEDGGWGETCLTYADPSQKGRGPSTPSQTAWALMGLMASGVQDGSVERGVDYLTRTQKDDGTWDETEYTGTGFPKVFYLEYTMYRLYFPLQALGNRLASLKGESAVTFSAPTN